MTDDTARRPQPERKHAPRKRASVFDAEALEGLTGTEGEIATLKHRVDLQMRRMDILMRKLATMHETMVATHSGGRAVPVDDPFAPLNPVEARDFPGGSEKTILSFAGMALRNNMPPREFMRSLSQTRSNVILCKDFRQAWYQQGLLGSSVDVPGTVDFLMRSLLPDQTHIATMGSSSGGYAAILFGVLMGADKILAFGPQTALTKFVFNKFDNSQSTFFDLQKNGKDYFDLATVIEANPRFKGQIQIHFSADNPLDRRSAAHLQRFDFVEVFEHPGDAHGVAAELVKRGEFQPLLDWLAA